MNSANCCFCKRLIFTRYIYKMEIIYALDEIGDAAKKILLQCGDYKIFTFTGDLGAGKTTFIKAMCRQLGVLEPVTSPTYSIIQEYRTQNQQLIYHMDFYRINSLQEAIEAGAEESISSGELCMIEWPDKIVQLLPHDLVKLDIIFVKEYRRKMVVQLP